MFQSTNGIRRSDESRNSLLKYPNRNMNFLLEKLRGLGCHEASSLPVSTPEIIRSAAGLEGKKPGVKMKKRKKTSHSERNRGGVAVSVPDICCAPPGVGIGSDFALTTRQIIRRIDNRKHSRAVRRIEDGASQTPAILSRGIRSRTYHRSSRGITETMLLHQNLLSRRVVEENDPHVDWRLNVDFMSYEELIDLGNKMGSVGTGLQEEEISSCIKKYKFSNLSTPIVSATDKDWKCSICQEKCRDDAIGALECGHYHHVECIKQWLLLKNACPVCKLEAKRGNCK